MIRTILPALVLASLVSSAALADQAISVPPFKSIELHGGGVALLRHGDRQRVVLIKGDPKIAQIEVTRDGTLKLSSCDSDKNWCWGRHELKVEVTTPSIAAIAVHGGGDLKAERGFPTEPNLALSVHGGGDADVRSLAADNVSVAVHGGGEAKVRAERTLAADVHGGGEVRFWGHPQVTSSTHGGGEVESGE